MPERPKGPSDRETVMGYKSPEQVSSDETAASRGRVIDYLQNEIVRMQEDIDDRFKNQKAFMGHELPDLNNLKEAYKQVQGGDIAREVEKILRDYLTPELMGDVDKLVAK